MIIDCDFRKPNLAKSFGAKKVSGGLSELLQGKIEQSSKVISQVAPNVDLLTAGNALSSPGQVLTNVRFREVLDELGQQYDRIILDSAPCQPVSDSLLLAKLVDGIVFVVRYDSTSLKLVQTSLKRLSKSKTPVLGLVLNRVNPRAAHRADDSYYHGKTYYG